MQRRRHYYSGALPRLSSFPLACLHKSGFCGAMWSIGLFARGAHGDLKVTTTYLELVEIRYIAPSEFCCRATKDQTGIEIPSNIVNLRTFDCILPSRSHQ